MKTFTFKKMDAFATATSGGNPAAAVYLDSMESITEPEMQQIARELKGFVSEVGYIARIAPDAFKIRYFSSEKEVQFCGHATIAIMHDLVTQDPGLASLEQILLQTNKGVFAAPFGYLEDPATGSGNAALGYHLQRRGHWNGTPIRLEQNADLENPNIVRLSSIADAKHGIRVIVGGGAIVRIEGRYCL